MTPVKTILTGDEATRAVGVFALNRLGLVGDFIVRAEWSLGSDGLQMVSLELERK